MNLLRIIKLSGRQLFINKSKSIYAIIGLSIGIAAVVTMVAIGNGAKEAAINQLEKTGTNLIIINAGKINNVMERRQNSNLKTTLRMKDCKEIANNCTDVKEVVPSQDGMVKVKFENTSTKCMINGISASYFKVKNFTMEKGVIFSSYDDKNYQRVTVIGNQIAKTLFEKSDPIGKKIMIERIPFTIVGVLKAKGITVDGSNEDGAVYIPINTALRRIFNTSYLKRIFIEVKNRNQMKKAEKEIITILRKSHNLDLKAKENDFTIDNQLTNIEVTESASKSFTWLIAGVSGTALIVGGIGVLAVMLLSVKERNEEIGLRISVGAKRRDIIKQFITESSILGLLGGFTGLIIGSSISIIIKYTTNWNIALSIDSIFISLLFSIITGLIFGVIPAFKASSIDPITALQKE